MAIDSAQNIENIIKQIAGDDGEYANSLMEETSNLLGYENFQAKQSKYKDIVNIPDLQSGPGAMDFTPNLHGDLTPAGIKQEVGSNLDMRLDEMMFQKGEAKTSEADLNNIASAWYSNLLKGIDSDDEFSNVFENIVKNPIDTNGAFRTVDQMKEELARYIKQEGFHSENEATDLANEIVDKHISPDIQDNFQELYYRSIGLNKTEIENEMLFDRVIKGEVSETELELKRRLNPAIGTRLDSYKENPQLRTEFMKIQADDENAISFTKLKEQFPSVNKEMAKPYYRKSLITDIVDQENKGKLPKIISENGEIIPENSYFEDFNVKDFVQSVNRMYGDVFTSNEITSILYDHYLDVAGAYIK